MEATASDGHREEAVSKLFRTQLVLMLFDLWDFGEHVVDPRAFELRLERSAWRVRT